MNEKINICRPGHGASCALCCGSHNYLASPEHISALFKERGVPKKKKEPSPPPKRLPDAIQCPHVGFTGENSTEIGCLKYNDDSMEEDTFFTKTCKTFFCPASDNLSSEEVLYAAELFGDWYYYSLLIHEINLLLSLMKEFPAPGMVTEKHIKEVKTKLSKAINIL